MENTPPPSAAPGEKSPVLLGLTDKALDRRDRHADEYVREIHDERLREIISNQSIIFTTVIPEPFKAWEASTHKHLKTPIYSLLSPSLIFRTDETSRLSGVRQKRPAEIEKLSRKFGERNFRQGQF